MPGLEALLGGVADSLLITNNLLGEIKLARTRAATTEWHDVVMEGVEVTVGKFRPSSPSWQYKNEMDVPISLRRIELLFDDEPSDGYEPIVEMHTNKTRFFRSKGAAFKNQDIAVDMYGGRNVNVGEAVDVYIWAKEALSEKKAVTISAQFGEL